MSSMVRGVPSENLTPGRILNVADSPSLAICQLVASSGSTDLRSGASFTSRSLTWSDVNIEGSSKMAGMSHVKVS